MKNDSYSNKTRISSAITLFVYCWQLLFLFISDVSFAEDVVSANRISGKTPIIDAAINGTPIVHIAPPNDDGLSHNQYSHFNVGPDGLILNNSTESVQTQLGGWITESLQLLEKPADLILNEVTSTHLSNLNGFIEVAGPKTDLIIANPNGINCAGCGFINSNKVTMTTGVPVFNQEGALGYLDVTRGNINISGAGVNASELEQLDLLARSLVVEGDVWAQKLNVLTGSQRILPADLSHTSIQGSGYKPLFAVDVKNVGGMYANTIHLIATEEGLGVNSTGRIVALDDDLTLSANGDVSVGEVHAANKISIGAEGDVFLNAETTSVGLTIVGSGRVLQAGSVQANNINISAKIVKNTGSIFQDSSLKSNALVVKADSDITNSGRIHSQSGLYLKSATLIDQAGVISSNSLITIDADDIRLDGTQLYSTEGVTVTSGKVISSKATIGSEGTVSLHSKGSVVLTDTDVITDNEVVIKSGSLAVTDNGRIDSVKTTIHTDNLSNTSLISGKSELTVVSISTNNTESGLIGGGFVTINTESLSNRSATIQASDSLMISARSVINSGSGDKEGLISLGDVKIKSHDFDNSTGKVVSKETQEINVSGSILNDDGLIQSGNDLNINSNEFSSDNGRLSSVKNINLDVNNSLSIDNSTAYADGSIKVDAGRVNGSSNTIQAIDNISITATGQQLTTTSLYAGGNLDLVATAGGLDFNTSHLNSDREATLTASGAVNLDNGSLLAGENVGIQAGEVSNESGIIAAGLSGRYSTLTIDSGHLDNRSGTIVNRSGKAVINTAGSMVDNRNGWIESTQSLTIDAGHLNNSKGQIKSAGAVLSVSSLTNNNGLVHSSDQLTINASSVENNAGLLQSAGALVIAANNVTNYGRAVSNGIVSMNSITLRADSFDNRSGRVIGEADVSFNIENTLDNTSGEIHSGRSLDITAGRFASADSKLVSDLDTRISTKGDTTLTRAAIHSNGKLTIDAAVVNAAEVDIQSQRSTTIRAESQQLTHATINSGGDLSLSATSGDLQLSGSVINVADAVGLDAANTVNIDQARVLSGGGIDVEARYITNRSGEISAGLIKGNAAFNISGGAVDNTSGLIFSNNGSLQINTDDSSLNNSSGRIESQGALVLQTGGLNNTDGTVLGHSLSLAGTDIDNRGGTLSSNGQMDLQLNSLNNDTGLVQSGDGLALNAGQISNRADNDEQGIFSQATLTVIADTLDNLFGNIASLGALEFDVSDQLNTQDGTIQSADSLTLKAGTLQGTRADITANQALNADITGLATLDNASLDAGQALNLTAGQITADTAQLYSEADMALTAADIQLTNSVLNSQRDLALNASTGEINLQGSDLSSVADASLQASGRINLDDGVLVSGGDATLTATELSNRAGQISAGLLESNTTLQLTTGPLDNADGLIFNNSGTLQIDTGSSQLNNHTGRIESRGTLVLQTGTVDNTEGTVLGNGLSLTGTDLDNREGILSSTGQVDLQLSSLNNDTGLVQSSDALVINAGQIDNRADNDEQGIFSQGTLTVIADTLDNLFGNIASLGALEFDVSDQLNTQDGTIQSADSLTLKAGTLQGTRADITASQALNADITGLATLDNANLNAGQALNLTAGQITADTAQLYSETDMAVAAADIQLTSSVLNSQRDLALNASAGEINLQGSDLSSVADASLQASGRINLDDGVLASGGDATLTAAELSNRAGQISAGLLESNTTLQLTTGSLDNTDGLIFNNSGTLQIDTGSSQLNNHTGRIESQGALTLLTGAVDNTEGTVLGDGISLTGSDLDNREGTLSSTDQVDLQLSSLNNDTGLVQSSDALAINAGQISNRADNDEQGIFSQGTLTVIADTLDNLFGSIASLGNMVIDAESSLNTADGIIQSAGDLSLQSGQLTGDRAQIIATGSAQLGATGNLSLDASTITTGQQLVLIADVITGDTADLQSGGNLDITAGNITLANSTANTQGNLLLKAESSALDLTGSGLSVNGASTLTSTGSIDLTDAELVSGAGVAINAKALTNLRGTVIAGANSSNADLILSTDAINNRDGTLLSTTGRVDINSHGQTVDNTRGVIDGHSAVMVNSGDLNNNSGLLQSSGNIALNVKQLSNTDTQSDKGIVSLGSLSLSGSSFDNRNGRVVSQGTQQHSFSGAISTRNGLLHSASTLTLNAQSLAAGGGTISADGNMQLSTAASTELGSAEVYSGGQLRINASNIQSSGFLQSSAAMQLSAGGLQLSGATLNSQQDLTLTASSGGITLQDSTVSALGNAALSATGTVSNQRGSISTGGGVQIAASQLDNTDGTMVAGLSASNASLAIDASTITNAGGTLATQNGDITLDTNGNALDNSKGTVQAGGALVLAGISAIKNTDGVLISGEELSLNLQSLDNTRGLIQAGGSLDLGVQGTINNSGTKSSGGLVTSGDLTISAAGIDNQNGYIASAGKQDFDLTGDLNNSSGELISQGDMSLDANNINNSQGYISGQKAATVTANQINNNNGTIEFEGEALLKVASLQNDGGELASNTLLTVETSSTQLQGKLASQYDLVLKLDGDFNNTSELIAGNSLSITANSFTNSSLLSSAYTLELNGTDLTNDGQIYATDLRLNMSQGLFNNSGGVIDGDSVLIEGGYLHNYGRIYGDDIGIGSSTFHNYSNAVIASRGSLALDNQTIINEQDAMIYSLGDMSIRSGSVSNNAALIEASGNLSIVAGSLTNSNSGVEFTVENDPQTYGYWKEKQVWGQPIGSGFRVSGDIQQHEIWDAFGGSNYFTIREYIDVERTVVNASAPGKIIAGGNMTISGGSVTNTDSIILASGGLNVASSLESIESVSLSKTTTIKRDVHNHMVSLSDSLSDSRGYTWVTTVTVNTEESAASLAYTLGGTEAQQLIAQYSSGSAGNSGAQGATAGEVAAHNVQGGDVQNQAAGTATGTLQGEGSSGVASAQLSPDSTASGLQSQTAASAVTVGDHTPATGSGAQAVQASAAVATTTVEGYQTGVAADVKNLLSQSSPGAVTVANLPTAANGATSSVAGANAADARAASLASVGSRINDMQLAGGKPISGEALNTTVITTNRPAPVTPPSNKLFVLNTSPEADYLVETDPLFTRRETFLASDYMLDQLAKDPSRQLKRYGDGFYEQRLVTEQVTQMTGRRYLSGYSDSQDQFQALMDSGVEFAQRFQLSPGVELSADQMAHLTSDIVWMVETSVTLADGTSTTVLTPKVYLVSVDEEDLYDGGALVSASDITIDTDGAIRNEGSMLADNGIRLRSGQDIANLGQLKTAGDITLDAQNNILNQGGRLGGGGLIQGANIALTSYTGNIISQSTLAQTETTVTVNGRRTLTDIDSHIAGNRAGIQATGSLQLNAAQDIQLKASDLEAGKTLLLNAGNNIELGALVEHDRTERRWRRGHSNSDTLTNQVTRLTAGSHAELTAGNDLNLDGTAVKTGGNLALNAINNINLNELHDSTVTESRSTKKRSFGRKKVSVSKSTRIDSIGVGLDVGNNLLINVAGTDDNGRLQTRDSGDVNITAANINVANNAVMLAGGDLNLNAGSQVDDSYSYSYKKGLFGLKRTKESNDSHMVDVVSTTLNVGGNSLLQADGDINLTSADLNTTGTTQLIATGNNGPGTGNINLLASRGEQRQIHEYSKSGFKLSLDYKKGFLERKKTSESHSKELGVLTSTYIDSGGDISLSSQNNIAIIGSELNSDNGGLTLTATEGSVAVFAGTGSLTETDTSSSDSLSFNRREVHVDQRTRSVDEAIGSVLSAEDVAINAGQHINIVGSALGANNSISLNADEDINISSAATSTDENYTSHSSTTGVFSSGGLSVTAGSQTEDITQMSHQVLQVGSELLTRDGDITVNAGNDLNVTASRMDALTGDISLEADNVNLNSAYNTIDDSYEHYFKQSGLSAKLSLGVLDTAVTAVNALKSASSTDNARLTTLQAARTAIHTKKLLQQTGVLDISAEEAKDGLNNELDALDNDLDALANGEITSVEDVKQLESSIELSISVGSSSSSQTSNSHQAQALGSTLQAGNNIKIVARADDQREDSGNINSTGSIIRSGVEKEEDSTEATIPAVEASGDITLIAANKINLDSAEKRYESDSESKSKSWGVGVKISTGQGTGVFVSASNARGLINQTNLEYLETQLGANNGNVTLESGGDTTLHGAQVSGDSVIADIGGDLNIISQQDEDHYQNDQKSASAGVTIGPSSSFSFNYNKLDADSDYIAVQEQSGIFAGDGGFDITVGGNTDLKGAAIVGSNPDNNRLSTGNLSWDQLENHAEYDIDSVSVGISVSGSGGAIPSGGMADDSGSASSTTFSVVSDGTIITRDDPNFSLGTLKRDQAEAHQVLDRIFNTDKVSNVQDEVAVQQLLSQEMPQVIGNYAQSKMQHAENLLEQARQETDPAKTQTLIDEAKQIENNWGKQGTYRLVMHTLSGAMSGNLTGAAAALAVTYGTPVLADALDDMGIKGPLKDSILVAASAAVGGAANGVAGAVNTSGQTVNNYLTHDESSLKERLEKKLVSCRLENTCDQAEQASLMGQLYVLGETSEGREKTLESASALPRSPEFQSALDELQQTVDNYKDAGPLEPGSTQQREYAHAKELLRIYKTAAESPEFVNSLNAGIRGLINSALSGAEEAINDITDQDRVMLHLMAVAGDKDARKVLLQEQLDGLAELWGALTAGWEEVDRLKENGEQDKSEQLRAELISGVATVLLTRRPARGGDGKGDKGGSDSESLSQNEGSAEGGSSGSDNGTGTVTGGDRGDIGLTDSQPLSDFDISDVNLPELPSGYHYRTVGNEVVVARNPNQATNLPQMHLEGGTLVLGPRPGIVRSTATRSAFLKNLANSDKIPSNIRQWLEQGRVPPGYAVHHKKALFDGGTDAVENMVLQGVDLHKITHRFYRPGGKVPSIDPPDPNPY